MYISLRSPATDRTAPGGTARTRTVSSTVVSLGIVSMLTDISSESVVAVLPLYITGVLGMSTIAFGVLDGLYQGVSAVVRIAGGYTSDRVGHPKWIAFAGYGVSALARIGLLVASGFAAITAVIAVDRLGKGVRTAPRDALITAASPPERLGTAFGVHRTLDNIGAALGPLLAFVILLIVPDGFPTVFVASLSFALTALAILGLLVPDIVTRARRPASRRENRRTRGGMRSRLRMLARGPLLRVLAAAGILGIVTVGDGFVYLVLYSRSEIGAQWFPLFYVGTNIAFLALAIPLGRLADRMGRARVFLLGHAALLAAYVVAIVPVADIAAVLLCLGFLGAFYAATDGVLAALAAQLSPVTMRATGIATAQTVVALTRFLSAAGFGVLWFLLGRDVSLAVVAALLAAAIVGAALVLRPLRRVPLA